MATQKLNRAAVLEAPQTRITLKTRPIPSPGADEVLIRNHAIASCPVDWKMQDYNIFISQYPIVLGSDISGVISKVGASVTGFTHGDRVFGFAAVICNSNIDHGAFQTYTILNDFATAPLPPTLSFEEGSMLPMAAATAALGLVVNLGIPRPRSTSSVDAVEQNNAILVWGGASSVGTLVIQMARKIGLTVIATASPKHHTYLKTLGATIVVDYRSPEVVSEISSAAKNLGVLLRYAFDCVSEGETFSQCAKILSNSLSTLGDHENKTRLVLVLPWPGELPRPEGIDISQVIALQLVTQQKELCRWLFHEWLPTALADGSIIPSPHLEIVKGGLESTQVAWDRHKAGVSGAKLVLQVGSEASNAT
ncbi:MAG: hypothetical protein Q9181_000636 [Wetmoreana brouardii]